MRERRRRWQVREIARFIEAVLGTAFYRAVLRFRSGRHVTERLERAASTGIEAESVEARDLVRAVRRAVRRASRRVPWRAECLVQALTARSMLERRGIASTLSLGVRKTAGALEAHAWLEAGGRIVVGDNSELASFAGIRRYPAA
jgi:hypothetical protein